MGLGLFIPNAKDEEAAANRIVDLISRGVRAAEPFFEWLATEAVQESKLNVENQSGWLWSRFNYFRLRFDEACTEAERRKNESHVRTETLPDGTTVTIGESPYFGL